jgi:hypothetical protein
VAAGGTIALKRGHSQEWMVLVQIPNPEPKPRSARSAQRATRGGGGGEVAQPRHSTGDTGGWGANFKGPAHQVLSPARAPEFVLGYIGTAPPIAPTSAPHAG